VKKLSDVLGKARNRIHRLGIELEGGWVGVPPAPVEHDGSVDVYDVAGRRLVTGEIVSKPMQVTEWEEWVRAHYPTHCNATCGMHVHMSFRNALTYQRLMTPEYMDTLLAHLTIWARKTLPRNHYIFPRLKGENRYCLKDFMADQQARARNKAQSRYTVVNYCHSLHETVEVRVLPMFEDVQRPGPVIDPETDTYPNVTTKGIDLACSAIQTLLDITNAFLLTQVYREPVLPAILGAEGEELAPLSERLSISL
jgi:hypothetical protein